MSHSFSHPAHARPGIQPLPDQLYVITVLSNPLRWRSRYLNYWDFHKHITDGGAKLITVELALGDRPFEVTTSMNPLNLQLRTRDEMFHKENLCNLGARLLPLDAKYVAFIDADMIFTRPDWAQETLHLLQHYDIIQMFSTFTDLDRHQLPAQPYPGFMYNFLNWDNPHAPKFGYGCYGRKSKWDGAPGGAWAYRVEALRKLGGLMDRCILGAGDHHMALGIVQRYAEGANHPEMVKCGDRYKQYITAWQRNAAKIELNVGYMEAHMVHKFHGPRKNRFYNTRWKILQQHNYDPYIDIQTDHQGAYMWAGNKHRLRDDIRQYLRSRDEDATS